ncbi:unnamed protein product, partial [Owenia fusiformis]
KMATINFIRLSSRGVNRLLMPQFVTGQLSQTSIAAANKRSLMLTPVQNKRLYGPDFAAPSAISHWKIERALAVSLIAVIPACIYLQSPITDYMLTCGVWLHAHWHTREVMTDYIHGETFPKIMGSIWYALSATAFFGLCYFNYNDIGLGKAIALLWTVNK